MSKMVYGAGGLEQFVQDVEEAALLGMESPGGFVITAQLVNADATVTPADPADLDKLAVGDLVFGAQDVANGHTTVLSIGPTSFEMTDVADGNEAAQELGIIKPSSAPMEGCKIILVTDELAYPVKDLTLADLTPATFDGYAASSAVVWGTPFEDLNDNVVITGDKKQFLCTGDAVQDAVTAAAYVSNDGLTLLAVDIFDSPVGFEDAGDALDYVPVLSFVQPAE